MLDQNNDTKYIGGREEDDVVVPTNSDNKHKKFDKHHDKHHNKHSDKHNDKPKFDFKKEHHHHEHNDISRDKKIMEFAKQYMLFYNKNRYDMPESELLSYIDKIKSEFKNKYEELLFKSIIRNMHKGLGANTMEEYDTRLNLLFGHPQELNKNKMNISDKEYHHLKNIEELEEQSGFIYNNV